MASKSSRWCFTINNFTEGDIALLSQLDCSYLIYGKETGDSGTPHLQGYVTFSGQKRLAGMKKIHESAHWEIARGNSEQNIAYCSKQGEFTERGDRPQDRQVQAGTAEKERWGAAYKLAAEGKLDDIDGDIKLRFYRTLKEIRKDHMQKMPDAEDVTGVWFYGGPGTGKSRTAREEFPDAYLKMQNKWWDGYQGQDYVIIDDFDSKELGHHLKIWGDRYAFLAETKGGAITIRPQKIVITSNYPISEMGWDSVTTEAVKRRFKERHFGDHTFNPNKKQKTLVTCEGRALPDHPPFFEL